MNRFEYADPRFMPNEVYVRCDMTVRLYDGDIKVIILWILFATERINFSLLKIFKDNKYYTESIV